MSAITGIYETINLLHDTSGKARENFLQTIMNNGPVVTKLIRFLVDDMIVTNLAENKIAKDVVVEPDTKINSFSSYIDYLSNQPSGNDVSIANIQLFANHFEGEERDFVLKVAAKSVVTGIGKTTFNKVAKLVGIEQVPVFKVQLGKPIDSIKNLKGKMYVTEKLDGIRCIIIINSPEDIQAYSRSGRQITGLTEIFNQIKELLKLTNNSLVGQVLDGELLAKQEGKAEDVFRTTSGLVSSKGEKTGLTYNIFDMLTKDQFFNGEESSTYTYRRGNMNKIAYDITIFSLDNLRVVPTIYEGYDLDTIYIYLEKYVHDYGSEGLMINLDAPYETKRTSNLIKIKQVYESDGRITGMYEGEGEFVGTLGGIYITYRDIEIKVGSGFNKEERDMLWQNKDAYIGKIAAYRFTNESYDDNKVLKSVRFARWLGLRLDKDEVSYDN